MTTNAEHARLLHVREPSWSPSMIAAHLTRKLRRPVSRQSVEHALAVTHDRPGRPRKAVAGHCKTCRCAV